MDNKLINTFPSVIVLMPTYNHEMYIAQAIQSVLNQITNFDVYLYISDDASIDSTFSLASNFSNKNKVIIKLTKKENNVGAALNCAWLRNEAINSDFKYITILEGDDYWTDPYKLQKQVDFLEANNDFNSCFHSVKIWDGNEIKSDFITDKKIIKDVSSYWDILLYGNFIHTCSYLFRKSHLSLPSYFSELSVGDFFLFLEIGKKGLCKRLDFEGAVYRFNVGSFSSSGYDEMRRRFKDSLFKAFKGERNKIKSFFLLLKFNQDNLFSVSNVRYSPILTKYDLILELSFIQLFKSLYKFLARTELRKIER